MVFEQESANLQLLFGEMLFSVSFCLHAVIHLFSIVAVAASSQGLCRLSKVSGWLELKVSVFTAFSHPADQAQSTVPCGRADQNILVVF